MKFVQIVEFKTSNLSAVVELDAKWRAETEGKRTASTITVTQDRDKPNTYLWFIEFPSYEAAMRNNELPETQRIAQEMEKVTDGPPVFRNLDQIETSSL